MDDTVGDDDGDDDDDDDDDGCSLEDDVANSGNDGWTMMM